MFLFLAASTSQIKCTCDDDDDDADDDDDIPHGTGQPTMSQDFRRHCLDVSLQLLLSKDGVFIHVTTAQADEDVLLPGQVFIWTKVQ